MLLLFVGWIVPGSASSFSRYRKKNGRFGRFELSPSVYFMILLVRRLQSEGDQLKSNVPASDSGKSHLNKVCHTHKPGLIFCELSNRKDR